MGEPVIKIENLGKKFMISHQPTERYVALRDKISSNLKGMLSRTAGNGHGGNKETKEEFWALKDVSFEVQPGDRIGIVGRNGAGKSTLLKILSQITEPSKGRVAIRGRIASLLEVGTGFHPELSGRENIYLNGAILGMTRKEIKRKFDAIVDFAEVQTFLDTPVKRYSSGMFVRLAFAVAAHLEPEILIVDEVLAVGDAQFQKKCLGKMEDVSRNEGRTVLFVSHQMPTVLNLCETCVYLDRGQVREIGPSSTVVSNYMKQDGQIFTEFSFSGNTERLASKAQPYLTLKRFYLLSDTKQDVTILQAEDNDTVRICVEGEIDTVDSRFNLGFALKNEFGETLLMSFSTDQPEDKWPKLERGPVRFETVIDTAILNEGKYYIYLLASIHCVTMLLTSEDNICIGFEVVGNRGNSPYWVSRRNTILAPYIPWSSKKA